jgi:4-hydroxy 2-oxovalerate aldolase
MDNDEVKRIVEAIKVHWKGELGIHTHNNMGKALDNCLTAKNLGVKWLDTTITGMGRGAGNAQTENLLAVLSKNSEQYQVNSIYELAIRYFEPMQKKYGWGSNLLYFIGAQNNIHPTYIQNLLSDTHYGTDEIIGAISFLKDLDNPSTYDGDTYKAALSFNKVTNEVSGTDLLVNKGVGNELLILANGPSLSKYLKDIKAYIMRKRPIVISINIIEELSSFIDYYCITHNNKFLSEFSEYKNLTKPIILPLHRFSESDIALFSQNSDLIDYGLIVEDGSFEVHDTFCSIPYDITAAYAFAISEIMHPDKVLLVGFDGYQSNDPRQLEMIKIFSYLERFNIANKFKALTPSTYPIQQGSIYAPV